MHNIRPFIPQLFDNPGSLLYIGARFDAHSWLDELAQVGNVITVLEVWPANVTGLIGYKAITDLICGDVRYVDELVEGEFDYVFWWHGPEHLAEPEIEPVLQMLEMKCTRLIALACPYGVYPQGAHLGNVYEIHQTTLYPQFFEALGYNVGADGAPDKPGSEIVAWKVIG